MENATREGRKTHIYAIKVSGGQEANVARLIAIRAQTRNLNVFSVITTPKMKGYILVEADNAATASEAVYGIKNVKSMVPGVLAPSDIEQLVARRAETVKLEPGDLVEVISGPFKGMRAKVVRFSGEKQEATINLVNVPYQLQVTVSADYLKKVEE